MSSSWSVVLVVCGGDRKDEHETNALEIENDFEVDSRPRAAEVGRAAGSKCRAGQPAPTADLLFGSINMAHLPPASVALCWPSGEGA